MSSRGGELGFRKIRIKKTITFIFVLMRVEKSSNTRGYLRKKRPG